jgi:(p)ppGpp synthase/HD superfamily hydrolase
MNITDALNFAKRKHGEQKRKYTNEPYWTHPWAVQRMMFDIGAPMEVLIAAVLHDTLEDTDATFEEIEAQFGKKAALLVSEVTDISSPSDGNRAMRKNIDMKHLSNSSHWGATIKLADLIDNSRTIIAFDPVFAVTYLQEKAAVLQVLTHGHPLLRKYASDVLDLSNRILAR